VSVKQLLFFDYFAADITSGCKTITIRDHRESDYCAGERVVAVGLDSRQPFADLMITGVNSLNFADISERHAREENMTLAELKALIREIYPNIDQLYLIEFSLCN